MKFSLMHKDAPVAVMDIDADDGKVISVSDVTDISLMPVGSVLDGRVRSDRFKRWWSGRSIPLTRTGIENLLETLGITDPAVLAPRSLGLSLVDHYWIRPPDSDIRWSQVNFFENDFSEDLGDLLFGKKVWTGEFNLSSPDITSDGMLMKKWKVVGGRRCLLKAGESPYRQEPFNEVAASVMAETMGIDHVDYQLTVFDGTICSVCEDFIDTGTELVTAEKVSSSEIHEPGIPLYDHIVSVCSHHGLDIVPFLDRMLVFDYVIGNTDRHLNNFGIVRDAETLEWLRTAPLFDNGTSMGTDNMTGDIRSEAGMDCKPFSEYWPRQMALVRDMSWFDPDAVLAAVDEVVDIMSGARRFTELGRAEAIGEFLRSRVEDVRRLSESRGINSM